MLTYKVAIALRPQICDITSPYVLLNFGFKTPERVSEKLGVGIYNYVADMITHANPSWASNPSSRGAATTWVVWAHDLSHFDLGDRFLLYSWDTVCTSGPTSTTSTSYDVFPHKECLLQVMMTVLPIGNWTTPGYTNANTTTFLGTRTFRAQDLSFPRTKGPYGEHLLPRPLVLRNFR